jgi:hypothetical protein
MLKEILRFYIDVSATPKSGPLIKLSPEARTLSLAGIMRMSPEDAHARFVAIRFAAGRLRPGFLPIAHFLGLSR